MLALERPIFKKIRICNAQISDSHSISPNSLTYVYCGFHPAHITLKDRLFRFQEATDRDLTATWTWAANRSNDVKELNELLQPKQLPNLQILKGKVRI